jgi:hypothetical protein
MKFRQELFWDTNPNKIDPKKNAQYVIERIADFGRDIETRWAFKFYDKRTLKNVIEKSRCLRPSTKALWTLMVKK